MNLNRHLIFIIGLISATVYHPPGITGQNIHDRIILNLTDKPGSEIAVSWRTRMTTSEPRVQYSEATAWMNSFQQLDSVMARSVEFITDQGEIVHHCSSILTGLEPGRCYMYRVGDGFSWSEWNQFRTPVNEMAPFSFVWFGDPQNEIREHCSRIFREAFRMEPMASFWLFSGDIVSEPEDEYYRGLFDAGGFIIRTIPVLMAPGNHDRDYRINDGEIVMDDRGKKVRNDGVAEAYKMHFTLPENGVGGLEETSFCIDYSYARIIVLNSNYELAQQAEWLRNKLETNTRKWVVLAFHHPFYSSGRGRNDHETREAFQKIVDQFHVDLVLTGHDHAYSRSYKLVGDQRVNWNNKGTVYAVSVSGPKQYEATTNFPDLMEVMGQNMQLFQVIDVDEDELKYRAYTATGELFDSFHLLK